MSNSRLLPAVLALGCAALASVAPVRAESLSEVYALSLHNDTELKVARSAMGAAAEEGRIARAALLPQASAEGVWRRAESITNGTSSNPFATPQKSIVDSNAPGFTIAVTQPLIDLAAFHGYRRGAVGATLAALQWEDARQSLALRTADMYLQVLTAGTKLDAAQSAEDAFRLQLNTAKQKYALGMVRISSYLEAQAAFDAAVAETLVAKNTLSVLFDTLGGVAGKNIRQLAALSDSFVATPPAPSDFQAWRGAALANNLAIQIAQLRVDAAQLQAKARAADHLPTLSAGLSYAKNDDHRRYNNAIPDTLSQHGASVSLTLSVPLYNGGATRAAARQADYLYLEQRDIADGVRRDVTQKLHSTYLGVLSGVAAVNARAAAIVSSQSALAYAQKGFEEGVINMVDVVTAQKNVYQAKQNYADALYGYLIAALGLKQLAGSLGPADLDELNRRLDPGRIVRDVL